jgi:hypothetical protein
MTNIAKESADVIAKTVGLDDHAAWVRFVSMRSIEASTKRVTTWPWNADGSLHMTTKVRYSAGGDDGWTDDVNARGTLDGGIDDLRAIVLVYANDKRVDAFYTDLGTKVVRPCSPYAEIWWWGSADGSDEGGE